MGFPKIRSTFLEVLIKRSIVQYFCVYIGVPLCGKVPNHACERWLWWPLSILHRDMFSVQLEGLFIKSSA